MDIASHSAPSQHIIHIRNVVQSDASDVSAARELILEYAASLHVDLAFQGFAQEAAGLPGRFGPPGGALLVARCGSAPVGVCALRGLDPERAELKRLYLRPEIRRAGIGSFLLRALLGHAWRTGYRRVVLDTIPGMGPAQALYSRAGFRDIAPYYHNPIPGARFYELELQRPAGCGVVEVPGGLDPCEQPKVTDPRPATPRAVTDSSVRASSHQGTSVNAADRPS